MKEIYLIFSFIVTYFLYTNICSLKNNKCPGTFNQLKITNKKIHLHHWLIHLMLLPFSYFIKKTEFKYLFIGSNLAGIFHGIYTYDDWLVIVKD